jgi:hypothetical protein
MQDTVVRLWRLVPCRVTHTDVYLLLLQRQFNVGVFFICSLNWEDPLHRFNTETRISYLKKT